MGWDNHFPSEPEQDPKDEAFENAVDEAYNILWKLYKPTPDGCNFSSDKEQKLLNMINAIDKELGR